MTHEEAKPFFAMADEVARANKWPNNETMQAAEWYCKRYELYQWQLGEQPAPFDDDAPQSDVVRFEDEFEDFVISLQEHANVGGMTILGEHEDIDWEAVGDYLIGVHERGGHVTNP